MIDDQGELIKEAKLDSDVEAIVVWLEPIRGDIDIVGLEAGTLTQYLTCGLQAAGHPIVCMEARGVHAAFAAMRNKTDKNDARGIAQILRTGWYQTVHVKSIESYHIRALLSSRKAVLNKCIDLENEVRGLFKIFGLKLPPKLKHGAFDGAVRETIESDPALSRALLPLLDARLVLYRTFLEMDRRARKMASDDAICQPSSCIACGSTVVISNGELKAVNHDLDHSTTQFLVGNVLSLTGGVDEVWMKPQMTAAHNERDQKRGSSILSD